MTVKNEEQNRTSDLTPTRRRYNIEYGRLHTVRHKDGEDSLLRCFFGVSHYVLRSSHSFELFPVIASRAAFTHARIPGVLFVAERCTDGLSIPTVRYLLTTLVASLLETDCDVTENFHGHSLEASYR